MQRPRGQGEGGEHERDEDGEEAGMQVAAAVVDGWSSVAAAMLMTALLDAAALSPLLLQLMQMLLSSTLKQAEKLKAWKTILNVRPQHSSLKTVVVFI